MASTWLILAQVALKCFPGRGPGPSRGRPVEAFRAGAKPQPTLVNTTPLRCYSKAAEQDHVDACVNVAQMYHDGEGVAQSDRMAARWVERAADLGHPLSMYKYET